MDTIRSTVKHGPASRELLRAVMFLCVTSRLETIVNEAEPRRLSPAKLTYTHLRGQKHFLAVQGGHLEMSGNHVRLAAHNAGYANEIDVARAELARAPNAMKQAPHPSSAVRGKLVVR